MIAMTGKRKEGVVRYRVVVSRVQTSERVIRASSEEEAAKRVQEELDRPYGYLGNWQTISTNVDITEVSSPIQTAPAPVTETGAVLLSIKEAAAHLGIFVLRAVRDRQNGRDPARSDRTPQVHHSRCAERICR
jgi:hypothetical protein